MRRVPSHRCRAAAARRGVTAGAAPRPGHAPRRAGQRRQLRSAAAQQNGFQELPETGSVKEAVWPRLAAALAAARRRRPRGAAQHAPQAAAPRRSPCFPRRGACACGCPIQPAQNTVSSCTPWPSAPACLACARNASVGCVARARGAKRRRTVAGARHAARARQRRQMRAAAASLVALHRLVRVQQPRHAALQPRLLHGAGTRELLPAVCNFAGRFVRRAPPGRDLGRIPAASGRVRRLLRHGARGRCEARRTPSSRTGLAQAMRHRAALAAAAPSVRSACPRRDDTFLKPRAP